MRKFLKDNFHLFSLALIFSWVFSGWFKGGIITYGDWWYYTLDFMKTLLDWPRLWDGVHNLGRFNLIGMPFYLTQLAYGVFTKYAFPLSVSERLIFFVPYVILSLISPLYLSQVIFPNKKVIAFFATFFYTLNTYILSITQGGQLTVAVAYSLFPFVFAFFIKSLKTERRRYKILTALSAVFLSIYDFRFFYITALYFLFFLACTAIYDLKLTNFRRKLKNYFLSFSIFIALPLTFHLYWMLPMIFLKTGNPLSAKFSGLGGGVYFSWTNLSNAFTLYSAFWPDNIYGEVFPIRKEFILLPLFVFLSLIFKRKNKWVLFFSLTAFISIILVKGNKPPFESVYPWLFENIPGFKLFREPSKFFITLTLAYAFLLGIFIDFLTKRLGIYLKILVVSFFFIYLALLVREAFILKMGGTFVSRDVPESSAVIGQFISSESAYFRTLWVPRIDRFGYQTLKHPSLDEEFLRYLLPFVSLSGRNYGEKDYLNQPAAGVLLKVLGIKYLFIPDVGEWDLANPLAKEGKRETLETLRELSYLKEEKLEGGVTYFEADQPFDHFVLFDQAALVVGGYDVYGKLFSIEKSSFLDTPLIFAQQSLEVSYLENSGLYSMAILNEVDLKELVFSFLPQAAFLKPSKFAPVNRAGYWKQVADLSVATIPQITDKNILSYDFDYGHGIVFTSEEESQLEVPFIISEDKEYMIFLRSLKSRLGGIFEIGIDDKNISQIDSFSSGDRLVWEQIDSFSLRSGSHSFHFRNISGFNAVNLIALTSKETFQKAEEATTAWLEGMDVVKLKEASGANRVPLNLAGFFSLSPKDLKLVYNQDQASLIGKVMPGSSRFRIDKEAVSELVEIEEEKEYYYNLLFDAEGVIYFEILTDYFDGKGDYIGTDRLSSEGKKDPLTYKNKILAGVIGTPSEAGSFRLRVRSREDSENVSSWKIKRAIIGRVERPLEIIAEVDSGKSIEQLFEVDNLKSDQLEFGQQSSTEYTVSKKASETPDLLLFSERFDPQWYLNFGGRHIQAIPVHGILNGFIVDETGEVTGRVEFIPQRYVYLGMKISLVILVLAFFVLIFDVLIKRKYYD